MDKKTVRLALVGAGHAHIELIRQIFSIPISFFTLEITFITSTRYAYYSGMIPGLVAGQYDE
jgi:NADH dehydrogenase FAD-containing subunit